MKKSLTITTIAAYFMLVSALGVFASAPVSVKNSAKEIVRNEIIRSISCPDFVTGNSETNTVKAIVSVDELGNVTVGEINAGNQQLKNYVINQLQSMKLKNNAIAQKFVLVINFKAE